MPRTARIRRILPIAAVAAALLGAALTAPASAATGLPSLPLSTDGNQIVDSKGREVVLQGVNWFGFETANHAPHGLWSRDYKAMLRQIKAEGFNTIRMPFSLEAVRSSTTSGIDYGGGRNAALQGKTPLQVMDIIVAEAARQGLMIILDNHSQADDGFMYPLWFGQDGFTEADWISTWTMLADRFEDDPNVIAADLKNEPHGSATWGTGGASDWRRAAQVAGNAVLAANPDLLIVVEGIEGSVAGGKLDRHWWGGNLEGVRTMPVRLSAPDKLVYSPHEYGPGVFAQPWFSDPDMASILADRWEKGFGYIHTKEIAPLLIGEFGAKNVGIDTVEGRWIQQFADYLGRTGISWTFWSWNPNSGDTGGVLKDDWTTVHTDKMALLSALIGRQPLDFGSEVSPITSPEPITESDPDPDPVGAPGTGSLRVVTDSTWESGWCGHLVATNDRTGSAQVTSLTVDLATGSRVANVWNGTPRLDGRRLTITTPGWASASAGGTFSDTGFCLDGASAPSPVGVQWSGGAPITAPAPVPAPEPTPDPAPAPAPEPVTPPAAGTGGLTARFIVDSTWESGYCSTVEVVNDGSTAIASWGLSFSLPAGAQLSSSWNGTVTRSGITVNVTPEAWAVNLNPGDSTRAFGFCAQGRGAPINVIALAD